MPAALISKAFQQCLCALLLNLPPAGAEIDVFQIELGETLENITPDTRFASADVVVMINTGQLLTCAVASTQSKPKSLAVYKCPGCSVCNLRSMHALEDMIFNQSYNL